MKIILSNEEANLLDEITRKLKIDFAVVKNMAIYDSEMSCFLTLYHALQHINEAMFCDDMIISAKERAEFEIIYSAVKHIPEEQFTTDELKILENEIECNLPKINPCPACGEVPEIAYVCGDYFINGTNSCPYCGEASCVEMSSSKEKVIRKWNNLTEKIKCPLGGDETNDCADCAEAGDYHFANGECVLRKEKIVEKTKLTDEQLSDIFFYCAMISRCVSPYTAEQYYQFRHDGAISTFLFDLSKAYNPQNTSENNIDEFDLDTAKRMQEDVDNYKKT